MSMVYSPLELVLEGYGPDELNYFAEEGYNLDNQNDFRMNAKKCGNKVKEAKKACKAGNIQKGKTLMNEAISDLEKYRDEFKKIS